MKNNAYTDCYDCGMADSQDQSVNKAYNELRYHLSLHPGHNVVLIVNQERR